MQQRPQNNQEFGQAIITGLAKLETRVLQSMLSDLALEHLRTTKKMSVIEGVINARIDSEVLKELHDGQSKQLD